MTGGPVFVLFAHPALQKSRIHAQLVTAIRGIDGITVHDLDEESPDFHVNVDRELELLERHRTVVFQHPFYWYSSPALLKQWQDLVLEYGGAFRPDGVALAGEASHERHLHRQALRGVRGGRDESGHDWRADAAVRANGATLRDGVAAAVCHPRQRPTAAGARWQ